MMYFYKMLCFLAFTIQLVYIGVHARRRATVDQASIARAVRAAKQAVSSARNTTRSSMHLIAHLRSPQHASMPRWFSACGENDETTKERLSARGSWPSDGTE
jgi:hypothetical protein